MMKTLEDVEEDGWLVKNKEISLVFSGNNVNICADILNIAYT